MIRPAALIVIAAIAATAGCASTGSTSSAPVPDPAASAASASAAAAQSSAAAAAAASSDSAAVNAPCTTKECIAELAQMSLPGAVANDNSVITKAVCYKKTVVHHAAAGAYTLKCRAYYTDGTSVAGLANVLLDQDKITWQPTG